MSEDPLVPRPAATVMLIRDTSDGIKVFLMRRHRRMDFVGGVMVFPGGGVDDRDRNADIAWHGPDKYWWGERLGDRRRPRRGPRLRCGAGDVRGVRRAVRRRRRRSGPARRRCVELPRLIGPRWSSKELSFAEFLRAEKLMLRADLLRPWANWVTPKEERTRRYDTYFFVGALPDGQRADGDNTESDRADWITPRSRAGGLLGAAQSSCCRRHGHSSTRWPAAQSPRCSPSNAGSCRSRRT